MFIHRIDRFGNGSCMASNKPADDNLYKVHRNITQYSQKVIVFETKVIYQRTIDITYNINNNK